MDLSPRLRFKLEKFKSSLRSAFQSNKDTYDTSHRMCPSCRALIARNEATCPHCGVSLKRARKREGTASTGAMAGLFSIPTTVTSAVVGANILMYALEWYMTQASGSGGGAGSLMGGISIQVLIRLGAKSPQILAGQWWRLVTAVFLHGGLLHIGMNLWCLFDLGPQVEALYSTSKYIVLYLVTGVAGYILSFWWNPFGISIGASGAIMGLIGILIGVSFHHGRLGEAYRGQLWRWVIYIFIFGLLPFFAIDNAAHLGGLLSGLVLGYFIPDGEPRTRAEETLWGTLAVLSVIIIAGSFALMTLQINQPI